MTRLSRLFATRRSPYGDERGSVIIVVIIIVILSVAVATLFGSVQGNLRASRVDQDRTAAFQRANGGIDHALYRFDRSGGLMGNASAALPGVASPTGCTLAAPPCYIPTVSGTKLTGFTESVNVDGSAYTITATADPAGQTTRYRVQSVGHDKSGRERQAVATIAAKSLFLNGFLTILDFTLTGTQDTPIAYNSAVDPDPAVSALTTFPIDGSLATNGTIQGAHATIDEFVDRWGRFNMYGRATQAAADDACASGDCTASGGEVRPFTDQYIVEIPPIPASGVQGCPNGGLFGSLATPAFPVIQPGNYVCPAATFLGTTTIGTLGNGTGVVRIWLSSRLRFGAGSIVNRLAVPSKLQIYYPEPADAASNDSTICDAQVWALLYTPGLDIACDGSHQPAIYGAVVARLHAGTGNHFDFHWDVDSVNAVHNGKYRIVNWRECPVSTVC
ncbi:MAG TPA: hypothetical protein VMY88_02755 [Acidimicrobiales bacterium]|nr:hypothetical protein [Acidimicrobiales bacterium]